jgi:hypothetical protein
LHLGLEQLERRALLSALAANDPNAGGPPAQSGVYTTGNNFTPGSATSSLGTLASVPGAPAQMEQTFLTVSPLYSGLQGPAAAYQRVLVLPLVPNQPLSSAPMMLLPTFVLPTSPVITSRPLRLGGTGGDTSLLGPLSSSVFDDDIQEDWTLFGNREPEGPTSEVPKKDLVDQLSGLGEMDNLLFSDTVPVAPEKSSPDSDIKDGDVKTDDGGTSEKPQKSEPGDRDGAAIPTSIDEEAPPVAHAVLPTENVEDQTFDRRASAEAKQAEQSRAAIGLAIGWLITSGEFGVTPADRFERFQKRQQN